jgi:multiple sugar transport system ATP-binding protein
MSEVLLHELVKSYPGGATRATDEVSLHIPDGEFMVLLGPSGCGKTTLLRMIAGLETPDSGQVVIGGRDVTYLEPRRRNLSMVFQSYAVFPNKNVFDNIGFGLRVRGVPADEVRRKVAWAAELLQLTPYLDRYPAKLSGGQRQRVAVARAIVVDAEVLLMDEPLSNLDALLRLSFRAELKKLVSELEQCGPPVGVYSEPADEFVGGFLGSPPMNFLRGVVGGDGADLRLDFGGQSLPLPPALASFNGRELKLGIRPEAITVDDGKTGVCCTVEVFEPLGSSTLLTTKLCGQVVKVHVPAAFRANPGDQLWLRLPPDQCRWYDPETQLALEAKE